MTLVTRLGPGRALLAVVLGSVAAVLVAVLPATASQRTTANGDCTVAPERWVVDDAEWAMVLEINRYRESLGLPPLAISWTLQRAARWKVDTFAGAGPVRTSFADHDDADRGWDQRILDCGYPNAALFAESLADTNDSSAAVLRFWQGSPVHNANLINLAWTAIGIARVQSGVLDGRPYYVWVADFGDTP